MTNETPDDVVALYRRVARERSSSSIDAHILAAAERADKRCRGFAWPIGLAAAATLVLAAGLHWQAPNAPTPGAQPPQKPVYADGTASYLMQMDVYHLSSPVAQYLTSNTAPSD
jgi:hypothetical protein